MQPTTPAGGLGERPPFPLAARLAVGIALAALGLAALLFLWLEPRTAHGFARLGADFLREGSTAMRELSHEQSSHQADLLMDLLRASTSDRDRALRELPLAQHGGDAEAIRASIADDDARRSAHERQAVLERTAALQRRIDASIEARLRALTQAQAVRTDEFIAELRTTHATLVAATLAVLLTVLGIGLHRVVVLPTLRLRRATQRVAAGDLDAGLPPAGSDEIGQLTHDFAVMTAQLRAARAEQQRFTASLAQQVAEKTAHLERALADLQASHLQLAQAERLAALGTLAGGVAHEFHNVIGGIRGCVAELAADEPAADRRETLAVVLRAADRGSAIVQQLLRFARRSLERESDVDLAGVLGDALALCEPAARRQRVTVRRELPTGLTLRADGDGLHQVFVNLLVNALQAMPDGGELHVRAQRVGDEFRVAVADTGCGIAAADLPHLFEPFFTTRRAAGTGAPPGSGLGLSVSWGIVAAHGGTIDVASAPGAGATFTVRLPVRPPAAG
jgi:signal transduction histidine kinase